MCLLGKMARDGVKVLWCCSHLVCLLFEGSIPTCACFRSENFFVTCSCFFFFWNSKREERWYGRMRGKCMVRKVKKV